MKKRVLSEEILDSLAIDHPDAVKARRDLRRLNILMGNIRWFSRLLADELRKSHRKGILRILELGAGDGWMALEVSREMPGLLIWHGVDLRQPESWPVIWGWTVGDVRSCEFPRCDGVVVNLFLHHLSDDDLKLVIRKACAACNPGGFFLASEPARRLRHVLQLQILRPVINKVTLSDGVASIRAGFLPGELEKFFPEHWQVSSRLSCLGALRLQARQAA